ncbi:MULTISPECIES: hypothetical protein [unclassified Pseudomonas]|uniref:hypothetical protein n=1 Tax=unclassified Pseudomonas TaxID=196821 RepID=UPI00117B370A|nr:MULTISPECIES: hypothetical protein [unclassified Pseudomonas]
MSHYAVPEGRRYVQIRFMHSDGEVTDFPPGRPVVVAALRHDPDHGKGPREITGFRSVYALVDTGADNNYATPQLLAEAGCPQLGFTKIRSANGWTDATHHLAHVFFPEIGYQYETDIFSAPLVDDPSSGQSLIIGVLVLKTGRLVMDFQSSIFRLYVN